MQRAVMLSMDTVVAVYLASLAYTAKQMCLSVRLARVKIVEPAAIMLMVIAAPVLEGWLG